MASKSGITVQQVKDEALWGVDLVHPVTLQVFPDATIELLIRAAEDEMERDFGTFFGEKTIVTKPEAGESYDVVDDGYLYRRQDFHFSNTGSNWHRMTLRYAPVVSVEKVEIRPPGLTSFFTVPTVWLTFYADSAKAEIQPPVPWSAATVAAIALINMMVYKTIPHGVHIDYTAGIDTALLTTKYSDLRQALIKKTVLLIFERMLPGLSQKATQNDRSIASVSHNKSGGPELWLQMINQYKLEYREYCNRFRNQVFGPGLTFVG